MLPERPLSPGEQLLIRDHLRETGRTAAVHLAATAGGYVIGWGLGTAISLIHNALNRRRL